MISVTKKQNLSVSITQNEHQIISDVAESLGGDDLGLNPHELLEAALGACTSITVRMYAQRKAWPLEDIKVKVHVVKEGAENLIMREVELVGNLDQEQKQRLLEMANKCPIHKFLSTKTTIETKVI